MSNVIEISARRQGKSQALLYYIKYALELHEKLAIGTNDVDTMYERVKAVYPNAKLTKEDEFLLVENGE